MKTLAELAGELYDALETRTRKDGATFVCLKDDAPEWASEVVHKAHGDEGPNDATYKFIERVAGAIHDAEAEDEDSANEAVYEIESDPYTAHLTAWLAENVYHVYYLTEVLEEFGGDIKDGFQLLGFAQQKQIQEIGGLLVSALVELQEDQDS